MTYTPPKSQLRGLSVLHAEYYGKPHIHAYYKRDDTDSHTREEHSRCFICGKLATNVHHCPPKSRGRQFQLQTPMGIFILKPALFALCGSGTTGCHGKFHNGLLHAEWVWDDDKYAESWWSGYTLSHWVAPHSPLLYEQGFWRFKHYSGQTIEYRGEL